MKLVSEKYRKLRPTIEYLADEVVLAQAWKKTHAYMRTHNWYADTLALDMSALSLESNVEGWAKSLKSKNELPRPLELIPAAKSEKWVVHAKHGWVAEATLDSSTQKERKENPPIRPLSHLTIRDQSWATSLLLCLADAVETAQGDCSDDDFFEAQKKEVYSYGNRLVCSWQGDAGWFRWGNAETYRKFFQDYQSFLRRPVEIGRNIVKSTKSKNDVFVVNLDLSKFYDKVDRSLLLARLESISSEYHQTPRCNEFWRAAAKIIDWHWSTDSINKAQSLNLTLGSGIPQGLVAAGFLANAYLLKFDSKIGELIGTSIPNLSGVTLHDYCRYVDDIRLVISVEDALPYSDLNPILNDWVDSILHKWGGEELSLNTKKTQIIPLSDLDNRGSLSERLANIQKEISGPTDRDSLDSAIGVLEGLLNTQPEIPPEQLDNTPDKKLLNIAKSTLDVRPDTLKRFAANRLEVLIRNKRKIDTSIADADETSHSNLDNESELLAKKLIWAWMQDPSLALVLRKAFEIFPCPELAEPVLAALFTRSSMGGNVADPVSEAVTDFVLADLFRSCVDFHAYFQANCLPSTSDYQGFTKLMLRFANKCLVANVTPKLVERQALLLLAIENKPIALERFSESIQKDLHAILSGARIRPRYEITALYEVGFQITQKPKVMANLLLTHFSSADSEIKIRVLEDFAKRGGPFWSAVWTALLNRTDYTSLQRLLEWSKPDKSPETFSSRQQKLSTLITAKDSGLVHESALINLAIALTEATIETKLVVGSSPRHLLVSQSQKDKKVWSQIWRTGIQLKCKQANTEYVDPRYVVPYWIDNKSVDAKTVYWIGTILRATLVGNLDFTSSRWKTGKTTGYKGLRTGWYKRSMGMMHAPEALVGEYSTISKWASELIMKCLQWPGFESTYLDNVDLSSFHNLASLLKVLKSRLTVLDEIYCSASDMPSLPTLVSRPQSTTSSKFRLVSVQHLLPKTKDFKPGDPLMNDPGAKARNRDHISRICSLTYQTLKTKLVADGEIDRPCADLIIFPEVGVHIDDQDLLKRLADKTKSIVFAGLIFVEHNGKIVNLARWIIPDYAESGRQWIIRDQGKAFPTKIEKPYGVHSYRPCQHIIEVHCKAWGMVRISGAICYDATDLRLVSDLKEKTDLFVIVAHNKDVGTFDTMASALHYHMYQHVALVNKGEFGGSTIQAPFSKPHHRLISHAHGSDQISINVADLELDLSNFSERSSIVEKEKQIKTKPAGS